MISFFNSSKIVDDLRYRSARTATILILLLGFAVYPPCGDSADAPKYRSSDLLISLDSIPIDPDRQQQALLIDIRPAEQFAKLRIPGSLNMPLFAIKTKPFLKRNALIILDEGYRYLPIAEECALLRKAGFRVWILNGGLYVWSRSGMPLQGEDRARQRLNRVPPVHFFQERDLGDWIVLDVSEGRPPGSHALFSSSLSLPYKKDDTRFLCEYEKLLKGRHFPGVPRILMVDERGQSYDRLERLIQATSFKDVFFLEGGRAAYRKFLVNNKAAATKKPDARSACNDPRICR